MPVLGWEAPGRSSQAGGIPYTLSSEEEELAARPASLPKDV